MYRAGNEFSTPKEREAYLKNVVSTQLHRGLAHGLKAFTSLVHKKLYKNGGGIRALDAYSRDEISRMARFSLTHLARFILFSKVPF